MKLSKMMSLLSRITRRSGRFEGLAAIGILDNGWLVEIDDKHATQKKRKKIALFTF
jgi:hypothetical protein